MASIYRLTGGTITFNDRDIYHDLKVFRRDTVLVESGFRGFYPRLSGLDNLRFFDFLKGGRSSHRDILDIADKVGLDQNILGKKYHSYSLGTQQKMHLAKIFFGQNRLILMDEPTTGLDDASKSNLSALIRDELKHSITIIASHDVEFIRSIPAQILNLQDGKFV
jgi:ABC-type multidrug transport system ATPase subunit